MHPRLLMILVPIILAFYHFSAGIAESAGNENAKIALHLQPVPSGKALPVCDRKPTPPCNHGESHLAVNGSIGVAYDAYLIVFDGDSTSGISGAVLGLQYGNNLAVGPWWLCADLEFSGGPIGVSWPQSGSGNVITWNSTSNCQRTPAPGDLDGGVTAVLGALYVYAYASDTLDITPRQYVASPDFAVSDCSAAGSSLSYPSAAGRVVFGSEGGYDPCAEADTIAPGEIIDLSMEGGSNQAAGSFRAASEGSGGLLTWTAPGDDGYSGRPWGYEIRFSFDGLDLGNWGQATPIPYATFPAAAGSSESTALPSIPAGLVSMGIITIDRAGNRSPLSNIVTVPTQTPYIWTLTVDSEIPPGTTPWTTLSWANGGSRLALGTLNGLYVSSIPITGPPRQISTDRPKEIVWTHDDQNVLYSTYYRTATGSFSQVKMTNESMAIPAVVLDAPGKTFAGLMRVADGYFAYNAFEGPPDDLQIFDPSGRLYAREEIPDVQVAWSQVSETGETEIWRRTGPTADFRVPVAQRIWGAPCANQIGSRLAFRTLVGDSVRCVVTDRSGNILTALPIHFNPSQWSASGRFLLGWQADDDGEDIVTGEVAVYDIEANHYDVLPARPSEKVCQPIWCESTGVIAYLNLTTGAAVIAKLEGR